MTSDSRLHTLGASSLLFHLQKIAKECFNVPNLKYLREKTGMTAFKLASEADVSLSTLNRMENGKSPVSRRLVFRVLNVLSDRLGYEISIEDVEGLKVKEDA